VAERFEDLHTLLDSHRQGLNDGVRSTSSLNCRRVRDVLVGFFVVHLNDAF